jgi:Fe-S cluster biogenesis protein NfuA
LSALLAYLCSPLQGSCKSCSKSSITLKSGVESMMMHYVPEVMGVEAIEDEVFAEAEKRIEGKAD